jgi:hypothetical protein
LGERPRAGPPLCFPSFIRRGRHVLIGGGKKLHPHLASPSASGVPPGNFPPARVRGGDAAVLRN